VGTVQLNANEQKNNIPVLINIPPQVSTGEYTLYAGVYTFANYPYKKSISGEGKVCTVS